MGKIRSAAPDGIRVIVCLHFKSAAPVTDVQNFRRGLLARDEVMEVVDSSGAFDLMMECRLADLADYRRLMDAVGALAAHLIERFETSFICRRYVREEVESRHALWVPCVNGQQRVPLSRIDKICAEGDYVRIHSGDQHWLLPSTMADLENQLGGENFIRLHRSLLVRADWISRLTHVHRIWAAELADGTVQRIARARSAAVLAALRSESSISADASSTLQPFNDMITGLAEKGLH
jgi:two-component system response regulator AlgR